MDDGHSPLAYASPQPVPRPRMLNMVLAVLVGAFLIAMGSLCGAGVLAGLWIAVVETELVGLLCALLMLPFATAFLVVGILVMLRTIAALRGTPPRGRKWERWAAMIDQPWPRR